MAGVRRLTFCSRLYLWEGFFAWALMGVRRLRGSRESGRQCLICCALLRAWRSVGGTAGVQRLASLFSV